MNKKKLDEIRERDAGLRIASYIKAMEGLSRWEALEDLDQACRDRRELLKIIDRLTPRTD